MGSLGLGLMLFGRSACNSVFQNKAKAQFAGGGYATGEQIKTPLKASVDASRRGRAIVFRLRLADATGKRIRSLRLPTGRPDAPKVVVYNALGKKVYACTLKYG